MSYRNIIVVLILLTAIAWWFLREDPEAEVREAHQELSRLLSKTEGEANSTMLINARILQGMFAESCEVSGDAQTFIGRYKRDELVSLIIQVQGVFRDAELTFHELEVEFPTADDAVATFTAVLRGRITIDGEEEVGETREVVSRMRKSDGNWQFAEFKLAKLPETG